LLAPVIDQIVPKKSMLIAKW